MDKIDKLSPHIKKLIISKMGDTEDLHKIYDRILEQRLKKISPNFMKELGEIIDPDSKSEYPYNTLGEIRNQFWYS